MNEFQICKVELGSPTVEIILNTPAAVRCFDLNSTKNTIAVVDENSFCRVYSIATEALLYTVYIIFFSILTH